MKIINTFLLIIFISVISMAQVTIDPSFPTIDDEITITFDAEQGNAALVGVSPVYMHTGLITDQSNSPSDWKYVQGNWGTDDTARKMTAIGNNKHQFTCNIKSFYGVPDTETVEQLAFVFRNASGSIVGRASDGSDIYTPIYTSTSDLLMTVNTPTNNNSIIALNESITIDLILSKPADITISDNGAEIYSTYNTSTVYEHTIVTEGKHDITIVANDGINMIEKQFRYIVNTEVQNEEIDIAQGININSESSVTLALYAPNKSYIYVLGSFNDYLLDEEYFMNFSSSNDIWWLTIDGLDPEEEYTFQYFVDGEFKTADPFSEKVLDSSNDKYIDESVYPDLQEFPHEQTSGIVTAFTTNSEEYNWQHDDFEKPAKEDLVIYELMMRDFLGSHNYRDLTDTLDYLERLGINAIELMPVNEFEGNQSWGYNPSFHMALDKYYGTPEAFKAFVDAAHSRGIAVILDVVYNHAFSQSPLAKLYWDNSSFRPTVESPYLNVEAKHPYNVGYDMNHESSATKYFVERCNDYWVEEYHVDGYRFDLTKGFTQNYTDNDGDMAAHDQSRINILTNYANKIWEKDPETYVILEHFATKTEQQVLTNKGMMVWGNFNHDFIEASMGFSGNLTYTSYKKSGYSKPHIINYMESHDEERIMFQNNNYGNSSGSYNVKDLSTGLERAQLAAAFHLMVPGPKMIWQFGELGYDYSINRCTNGSINSNCRLDPKPIRWDYGEDLERLEVFNLYAKMNQLKTTNETFHTEDMELSLISKMKKIMLKGDGQDLVMIGNFDVINGSIEPGFTNIGTWYEYFSGEELVVTDMDMSIDLNPGEYRLYSSIKFPVGIEDYATNNEFIIFPNPSQSIIQIKSHEPMNDISWSLFDLIGNKIKSGQLSQNETIDISEIHAGLYILNITTKDNKLYTHKISKL